MTPDTDTERSRDLLRQTHRDGRKSVGEVMTNYDHTIQPDAEHKLKSGKRVGFYTAGEFYAAVWLDGEHFVCVPAVYKVEQAAIYADSLEDIMTECCERHGAD